MNDKEYSNMFRFVLTQGDVLLGEKMFDADHLTGCPIDIRSILPKIIRKFQKVLSKRSYDTIVEVGYDGEGGDMVYYDLYGYNQNLINLEREELRDSMRYNPESIEQKIEHRVIRGVPCKIGFYINENPIVEREFYVNGFNPIARQSLDVIDTVVDATDLIFEKIKMSNIKSMLSRV